jgi:hypothetical protein
VNEPVRRRYTRYTQQLSVRRAGADKPSTATTLGRGGMFLNTNDNLPTRSLHEIQVSLHEIGKTLAVEAEVLYRLNSSGHNRRGVGLRFHSFANAREESLLIGYLQELEHIRPHA